MTVDFCTHNENHKNKMMEKDISLFLFEVRVYDVIFYIINFDSLIFTQFKQYNQTSFVDNLMSKYALSVCERSYISVSLFRALST